MFGSFLPSLLVGFSTTNSTRASEPTLSWNHYTHWPDSRALSLDVSRAPKFEATPGEPNVAVHKPLGQDGLWEDKDMPQLRRKTPQEWPY